MFLDGNLGDEKNNCNPSIHWVVSKIWNDFLSENWGRNSAILTTAHSFQMGWWKTINQQHEFLLAPQAIWDFLPFFLYLTNLMCSMWQEYLPTWIHVGKYSSPIRSIWVTQNVRCAISRSFGKAKYHSRSQAPLEGLRVSAYHVYIQRFEGLAGCSSHQGECLLSTIVNHHFSPPFWRMKVLLFSKHLFPQTPAAEHPSSCGTTNWGAARNTRWHSDARLRFLGATL